MTETQYRRIAVFPRTTYVIYVRICEILSENIFVRIEDVSINFYNKLRNKKWPERIVEQPNVIKFNGNE